MLLAVLITIFNNISSLVEHFMAIKTVVNNELYRLVNNNKLKRRNCIRILQKSLTIFIFVERIVFPVS